MFALLLYRDDERNLCLEQESKDLLGRKFPIGAENFDFEAKIENPVETSDNISSLRYALLHRVHAQVI